MPTINKTFEELLKRKIETDLANYVVDRSVVLTNDINLYAKNRNTKGSEIIGILQTGNGQAMGGNSGVGITQAVVILFACPLKYRATFLRYLTDYTNSENQSGIQALNDGELPAYSFKANYNTPTTSGIKMDLNGYDYIEVTVGGSVFYGDFSLVTDSVKIDNASLVNILSSQKSVTPQIESHEISGLSNPFLIINSVATNQNYRILYKSTNTLHSTLKGYLDSGSNLVNSVSVSINNNSFQAVMILSEDNSNGFSFINVTLQKTGVY